MVGVGIGLFVALEFIQRRVRVPTPLWQALAIVGVNTIAVSVLQHLGQISELTLPFYMLNVAFATVAFGQHIGITAAFLSVATMAQSDVMARQDPRPLSEWGLFLTVLLTLVAILVRVNRLQEDALLDAVTGLRNHRYFQVRLLEELRRSDRSGKPTALLMIDLDNFKRINDRFGHAVGDHVLRQVGRVLVQNARAVDVVCRYGGEELTVLLPETTLTEAAKVAERLRLAVEKRNDPPGPAVTVSVGVAGYPEHASQGDGLIAAADAAMYCAKRAGKNRVDIAQAQLAEQE
jgi:diguanylate cyclase (GGDEF)-like protein